MKNKILIGFIIILIIGVSIGYFFINKNKCGDSICDSNIGENISNCPRDCPSYILHEWGVLLKDSLRTTSLKYPLITTAKPIIYIYSNNRFNLSLSIDFENGAAMEVWPYIPIGKKISWDNITISSDCETTPFPEDQSNMKEIYELGNYVVDNANCITYKNITSKILFYNGKIDFGNIVTGYYIDLGNKKQITLTNNLEQDIFNIYINYKEFLEFHSPEVYSIENATLGILKIDELKAGETKSFDIETNTYIELPIAWKNQAKEFKQELINNGLYTDEANKFMIAWENTFFGIQYGHISDIDYRNGMNIIFILPEEKYNNLFKLETSIKPKEIKRISVVYVPIEKSVSLGTTTTSASLPGTIIKSENNCESYTEYIKIYCNPFSSEFNKESCNESEKNYENNNCCKS